MLNIHKLKKMHENEWKGGCTPMSNGSTDHCEQTIINFMVNSRVGTFNLGSNDCIEEKQSQSYSLLRAWLLSLSR